MASSSSTTPATMKCILASELGDIDKVLTMSADAPRPEVNLKKGQMLVKVQACSLSPGDTIMLSGACDRIMRPPQFPFVPGMDICGVVEEVAEDSKRFKVGDRVMGTNGMMPVGGLAEYMAVPTNQAVKVPDTLDAVQAAAMPNSAMTAMLVVRAAKVKEGDRVLILGGSGGVGTSLVQLAKDAKAGFVAATSTDEALLTSLGADRVIDYRETNWWEDAAFKAEPFDVVVDCVGWRDEWKEAARHRVLKSGWKRGRYIVVASTDKPEFHSIWQGVKMFVPVLWRSGWTSLNWFRPGYSLVISDPALKDFDELAELVKTGRLKPVLEPKSPFPFTLDGVKSAFELQASKHAHGKVVISMSP